MEQLVEAAGKKQSCPNRLRLHNPFVLVRFLLLPQLLLTHRVEGVVENGNTDHFDEVLSVWGESANLFLILSSHDTEPTHSGFKTAGLEGLKALALDAGVRFKAAVRSGGQKHLLGELSEGESRGSGHEHFDTCNRTEIVACPPPTVQRPPARAAVPGEHMQQFFAGETPSNIACGTLWQPPRGRVVDITAKFRFR